MRLFFDESVTTIPRGSRFKVQFPIPKCHASYMDEEIVYSPNKYRETEGIKDCNDPDGTGQLCPGKRIR